MLSKEHDHLMNGAERSDSFSWNPHKMLGIPLQCSVFVCKHAGSLSKANSARAEYLFQPDKNNSGADLGDRTIQCGRKSDAMKLWLAWKLRGDEGFAKCIDRSFHLAKFVQLKLKTQTENSSWSNRRNAPTSDSGTSPRACAHSTATLQQKKTGPNLVTLRQR